MSPEHKNQSPIVHSSPKELEQHVLDIYEEYFNNLRDILGPDDALLEKHGKVNIDIQIFPPGSQHFILWIERRVDPFPDGGKSYQDWIEARADYIAYPLLQKGGRTRLVFETNEHNELVRLPEERGKKHIQFIEATLGNFRDLSKKKDAKMLISVCGKGLTLVSDGEKWIVKPVIRGKNQLTANPLLEEGAKALVDAHTKI